MVGKRLQQQLDVIGVHGLDSVVKLQLRSLVVGRMRHLKEAFSGGALALVSDPKHRQLPVKLSRTSRGVPACYLFVTVIRVDNPNANITYIPTINMPIF